MNKNIMTANNIKRRRNLNEVCAECERGEVSRLV
jgi:hypothetical protein